MPTVQRNGLDIHFTVHGAGRPVVLGHSFLCSADMWAPQVPPLAEDYRVINVDARGHGASGHARTGFTLYDMVDDVLAVMDHLGVDRAVWAGLSIGGMVALRAALVARERVEALILLDTDAGAERGWNRLKYSAMGAIARALGVRPLLPRIARQMFGATSLRQKSALVDEWNQRFTRVHVPSMMQTLKALNGRDDLLARLPHIRVPALVLVGTEDRSLPPERSRVLARGLPNAQLMEIEAAGHLSNLEQPEAVTAAMRRFLSGL